MAKYLIFMAMLLILAITSPKIKILWKILYDSKELFKGYRMIPRLLNYTSSLKNYGQKSAGNQNLGSDLTILPCCQLPCWKRLAAEECDKRSRCWDASRGGATTAAGLIGLGGGGK